MRPAPAHAPAVGGGPGLAGVPSDQRSTFPPMPDHDRGRSPSLLSFAGITKRFGQTTVLDGLELTVPADAFMVILGPPASGKTTLMRLLLGLETPDGGEITLRGRPVTHVAPADRNIGYVPQSFALYPHISVADNIAYPLHLAGVPKAESQAVVSRSAEMLHIGDLLAKRPDQLSGGQKQRVAIARGIAKRTDLYVFDDPLAGLDFKLRERLVDDLRALQAETGATFVYTTSDPLEALTLADHVAILDGGRIVEAGEPDHLYRDPRQARTMTLLGFPRANLVPGQVVAGDGRATCRFGGLEMAVEVEAGSPAGEVLVGIRPEDIVPEGSGNRDDPGALSITGRVPLREDLGGEEIVYVETDDIALASLHRHPGRDRDRGSARPGTSPAGTVDGLPATDTGAERVRFTIDPAAVLIFTPDGHRAGRGTAAVATAGTRGETGVRRG